MPELGFEVEGVRALPHCSSPTLGLKLRVSELSGQSVQAASIDCQVRIEAQRRRYGGEEKARLVELFGEPGRWSQTLRSLLWGHASASVPSFAGSTEVELRLPCTADFAVLAAKYFHALEGGTVPLSLLFSGSVFYRDREGCLQVERIPWSAEASYDMPVSAWKDLLDLYFPNTAWLTLRRDLFDRLYDYRTRRGLPTWEQTLEELLAAAEEHSRP